MHTEQQAAWTTPLRHPPEELYDMDADPTERRNLAGDEEHERTLLGLRAQLKAWMIETDDPLLSGMMPSEFFEEMRGGG